MKAMKKFLSAVLSVTMFSVCALTANAAETSYGFIGNGISNQEYQDYVSKLTISKNEERLIKLYDETYRENGANPEAVHVYIGGVNSQTMYFEFVLPDNTRIFQAGFFMGTMTSETPINATDEEMNKFLAEKGLKGQAWVSSDKMSAGVIFDQEEQDRTYDDVVSTRFALCDEYALDDKDNLVFFDTTETFTDESTDNTEAEESSEDTTNAAVEKKTDDLVESETVTENVTATLRGDADLNNEVGLSDVIAVAKFTINSSAYPLKNNVALANADVNNDDVVDSLDETKLIEYNLNSISKF